MRRFFKKGQSTLEYAVIIAVVMAGLLAMQIYLKRGYQNKLRDSADEIGGGHYSAGFTTSEFTTVRKSQSTDKTTPEGESSSALSLNTESRSGKEEVAELGQENLFK